MSRQIKTFQPELMSTVTTVVLLAVLLGLAGWQFKRLAWKNDLVAQVEEQWNATPIPMPHKIGAPGELEFRRVLLTGQLLDKPVFLLRPRVKDGVSGVHVVVPFRMPGGRHVFVDRGWSKDGAMGPDKRTRIIGRVMMPSRNSFTPQNVPETGEWYWADIDAMAASAGIKFYAPVLVSLDAEKPEYPNNHRYYAFFWLALAGALVIVYLTYSFRAD